MMHTNETAMHTRFQNKMAAGSGGMSSSTGAINGLPLIGGGMQNISGRSQRPRPQPISGTPPPDNSLITHNNNNNGVDRCDFKTIQQTCSLFGLDLERPPPVPPSRPYTVNGNRKIAFPQSRVMKKSFPEESLGEAVLR